MSLWPFLQRCLEVEKITREGAEFLLAERSEGLDNWTFRKDSRSEMLPLAVPSVFITFSERGEIIIERSRLKDRHTLLRRTTEALIHLVVVIAPDDQRRKFFFGGTDRISPVNLELLGGHIYGGNHENTIRKGGGGQQKPPERGNFICPPTLPFPSIR